MSHKAGHIVIESAPPPTGLLSEQAGDVVTASSVELNFPSGMPIEDRIKHMRHVMLVLDKLEHPDA